MILTHYAKMIYLPRRHPMKTSRVLSVCIFLFPTLLVLSLSGCSKESSTSPETGAYKIEGRVVDTNGKGVADVTVTVTGSDATKTATSNSEGIFSITGLKDGVYVVKLNKESILMAPSSTTVTVSGSDKFLDNVIAQTFTLKMVSIPAGTFQMGTNDLRDFEKPVHTVILSAFFMSAYEITNEQYKAVTGSIPSKMSGENTYPAENMTWWDAIKFCNALSDKAGLGRCYNWSTGDCDFTKDGFRLATEAEWEYACRAGTTTKYYTGDTESDLDRAGWYAGNSGIKTHPVGQKIPNAWGLYDMIGNVWEYCNDYPWNYTSDNVTNPTGGSSGDRRANRGGCFGDNVGPNIDGFYPMRFESRGSQPPDFHDGWLGIRVVRR